MAAQINRNSIFYKLKNLFRRVFKIEEEVLKIEAQKDVVIPEVRMDYSEKIKIAENIINDKTYIEKLTPEETEEMIDYFNNDIKEIDRKIEETRRKIERLRKKVES